MAPVAPIRRPVRADRSHERRIALGAIAIAMASLAAAVASLLLPPEIRLGAWLPLHLALAAAATTAIAGIMPFFSAALAAAPPASPVLRTGAVALVSAGAWIVALGVVGRASPLAAIGGIGFVAGIALTGLSAFAPLRHGLGPSRGLVTGGYVAALCSVALGASLAVVFLAGWPPLVEAWGQARPTHAWLNLVGFVTLTIATTLLHFLPTVSGARIVRRRSAILVVGGLAGGVALVATGIVVGSDAAAQLGALVALAGSLSLGVYAWQTLGARARWTSDAGWHRFATGGLLSAIAWLQVGMAVAVARVVAGGAAPATWSLDAVGAPLVVGWVGIAIVGSATHLIPAIGPGNPVAHARQRMILGRAATLRLVVLDVGVAILAVGMPLRSGPLIALATLLLTIGLGATVAVMAAAIRVGLSGAEAPSRPAPRT